MGAGCPDANRLSMGVGIGECVSMADPKRGEGAGSAVQRSVGPTRRRFEARPCFLRDHADRLSEACTWAGARSMAQLDAPRGARSYTASSTRWAVYFYTQLGSFRHYDCYPACF